MTVQEYLEQWIEGRQSTLRRSSISRYRRDLRLHVIAHLGALPLAELDPHHLDRLYAMLLTSGRADGAGGLSRRSVQHTAVVLHKALDDAVRRGLLFRNVADLVDPPKRERKEQPTWSAQQVQRFLEGTRDEPLHAIYRVALSTGMRQGEILGLRWRDVDFEHRRISVVQAVSRTDEGPEIMPPKTARSRRSIPMSDDLIAVLEEHRGIQTDEQVRRIVNGRPVEDHDLVFAGRAGRTRSPQYVTKRLHELSERLDLPRIRFHDLRHTWATLALQAGVNSKTVADILGHEDVSFTLSTYAHAIPALEADAVQRVEDLFRPAPEPPCGDGSSAGGRSGP